MTRTSSVRPDELRVYTKYYSKIFWNTLYTTCTYEHITATLFRPIRFLYFPFLLYYFLLSTTPTVQTHPSSPAASQQTLVNHREHIYYSRRKQVAHTPTDFPLIIFTSPATTKANRTDGRRCPGVRLLGLWQRKKKARKRGKVVETLTPYIYEGVAWSMRLCSVTTSLGALRDAWLHLA